MRRTFASLLLLPLAHAPAAAAVVSDPGETAMTTVTLHINSCPDCTFSLIQSKKNGSVGFASDAIAPDEDGDVVFIVPTDRLSGVLVAGRAPDNSSGLSQYVVMRFKGQRVGDSVSRKEAQSARKASPCWAGTSASSVELDVAVERRVGESDDQVVTYDMWTTNTQKWWNPMLETQGGSLEAFDVIPCSPKKK